MIAGPGRERWKRATLQVEKVGRRFDQQCIMQWYPHEWGAESPVDDPLRHTSVIQAVVTIRSMVQKLRSLGVAHRVNPPLPEPDVSFPCPAPHARDPILFPLFM